MNISGDTNVNWMYPTIGTCGEPVQNLRISVCRVRAIPDIIVGFDGNRDGWVICGSFRTKEGDDFEYKEVAFIPEDSLDEDRFSELSEGPNEE